LEAYKHQQQKELEELRFKISGLLDRTTKLHQREFEVLPEAWAKLVIAHAKVQGLVSAFQEHPDLDRMTPKQLEEFIQNSQLKQWQKDELRSADGNTNKRRLCSAKNQRGKRNPQVGLPTVENRPHISLD